MLGLGRAALDLDPTYSTGNAPHRQPITTFLICAV
jgi:hypothetical protein